MNNPEIRAASSSQFLVPSIIALVPVLPLLLRPSPNLSRGFIGTLILPMANLATIRTVGWTEPTIQSTEKINLKIWTESTIQSTEKVNLEIRLDYRIRQ